MLASVATPALARHSNSQKLALLLRHSVAPSSGFQPRWYRAEEGYNRN